MLEQEPRQPSSAFVVMPFDEEFDAVYAELIVPSLQEGGFSVRRADSLLDQQNIIRDIVQGIDSADLVIADLTGLSANVLYELGLAHGLGRPVVLLTQDLESVPFDLRSYRIIPYSVDFRSVAAFKQTLSDLARGHRSGDIRFGNPVSDFAPSARGLRDSSLSLPLSPTEPTSEGVGAASEEDAASDDEPLGLLEHSVALQAAMEALGEIAVDWSTSTVELGRKVEVAGEELQLLNSSGAAGRAARVLTVTGNVAKEMHGYSLEVHEEFSRFEQLWRDMVVHVSALLGAPAYSARSGLDELVGVEGALERLDTAIAEALPEVEGFRGSVVALPPLSKGLTRAAREVRGALDVVIEQMQLARSQLGRVRALIQQRMAELRALPE